ncbi:hypothetical protein NL676_012295 [Syzygium grande]|nr:hypothetical protein NL676_012295 [Syzygium grande]
MRDLQRSQMGERNKTLSEATAVMKILSTPKASLAKIELLMCLTAFLLILLNIFGSWRRRHNNPKFRILLWAACNLSSYLIACTLSLMTKASFQNQLLPVWAIFLMIFFGSSDSYSTHSLEDCEQWMNYFWQYMIKVCGLSFLWSTYANKSPMILALFVLLLIVPLKNGQRASSPLTASRHGQQVTTKLIADYMISEHRLSEGVLDPIQMRGYNYVVRGEETNISLKKLKRKETAAPWEAPDYRMLLEITDRVVTIEKVWNCEGWLLRLDGGDEDSKLKDICLSFSLYKLLRLRFSGYSLPKEARKKLRKLIRNGLLAEINDYERAFRVIELELSFLFDLFYTNKPIIFLPSRWLVKVIELLLLVIGSLLTIGLCFWLYNSNRPRDEVQLATTGGLSIDALVTALILIVFTCVDLVQFFFMAISDWAKVSLLCNYVQTNSWQGNKRIEKLIGLICRKESQKPWDRKLRQYSLLDQTRYCKKQSAPAELSPKVKKAVFRSLMSNRWILENGKASLRLNEVQGELSWACGLKTQTQVIIVWHIATSICEHETRISNSNFYATPPAYSNISLA